MTGRNTKRSAIGPEAGRFAHMWGNMPFLYKSTKIGLFL